MSQAVVVSQGFEEMLDWIETTRHEPLTEATREAVTGRILDYAANVAGGSPRQQVQVLAAEARSAEAGEVPLPGGGAARTDDAMLPWGAAAHVLECDDTHQPSSTHPGAVIVTAALLHAGAKHQSLRDVATAIVVGYEVMCRLGSTTGPADEYARGFHPTGTCGAFGAAAACAVLDELDRDSTRSALGIAASLSSGSMSFLTNGAWTKLLHPGAAARAGHHAARWAARGYKGPADPLSAPHGYYAGHTSANDPHLRAPRTGEVLAVGTTSVKAHGCCRYEQGPIDALLSIRSREQLSPEDIVQVRIGLLDAAWPIVAEPVDEKRRPQTVVDSQFSMAFGAALALAKGSASAADHTEAALADPAIHRLADVVECYRDADLDASYPRLWKAVVEVTTATGDVHRERVDHPKGDPENPFTLEELAARVTTLAPWAETAAPDVISLAYSLEGDARDLVNAVGACFPASENGSGEWQ
jgi:2-methylcitrate dehydratase PrpD